MLMRRFYLLIWLLLIVGTRTIVSFEDIQFHHAIFPEKGSIGDIFDYELTVTYNPSFSLSPLSFQSAPTLHIHDLKTEEYETQGSKVVKVKGKFSFFEVGENRIPTQTLTFVKGSVPGVVFVPALSLSIESVLSNPSARLKDSRFLNPYLSKKTLFHIAFILLALLGVGWVGYRLWKKRQNAIKRDLAIHTKDLRPAWTSARERLSRLKHDNLIAQNKIKEHYLALTEIMKHYFSEMVHDKIAEMTTEEMLERVQREVDEQTLRKIKKLFELSDSVKFAGVLLTDSENQDNMRRAFEIVDRTAPLVESEIAHV